MSGAIPSVSVVTLLASVALRHCDCHVHQWAGNPADGLVDKVLDRSIRAPSLPLRDLDNAALGKSGQLAVPTSRLSAAAALPSRPAALSSRHLAHLGGRSLALPSKGQVIAKGLGPRTPIYYAGETGDGRLDVHIASAEPLEAAVVAAAAQHEGKEGQVEEVHSKEELQAVLRQTSGLVVLEVVATWCRKCRTFASKYRRLAGDFRKVKFVKIVGNENESTRSVVTDLFNVKKTPTHYFFRDGEAVAKEEGGNEETLRSMLNLASG